LAEENMDVKIRAAALTAMVFIASVSPSKLLAADRPCTTASSMSALGSLSEEERKAVVSETPGKSPVVAEAIARIKPPSPQNWSGKATRSISWTDARKIILMGAAETISVGLDRTVIIISRSGKRYKTMEPSSGNVVSLVAIVDPCHVFLDLELQ
jgi:hypothetical protein